MIKFAERLQELRRERHVTQKSMAEFLGIQMRSYQSYEGGDRRPDYEKLVALADYFGVTRSLWRITSALPRTICWGAATRGGNMGWAAGRRPRGIPAPAGGLVQRDAPPISLLPCQKRNGPCTVQREKRLARSGAVALRATGGGVSVPAPILPDRRARYALLRFL